MSRREIVVLVSRALACVQLITALLDVSYLPEKLFSFLHYVHQPDALDNGHRYFRMLDSISILTQLARIGILLVAFLIFWNCGDWIEQILLPAAEKPSELQPN